MITSYQEQVFYHYILDDLQLLNLTNFEYFSNANVRELFSIAKSHTEKYKEAPSKDQMIHLISVAGLSEKYNAELVESLYNTKLLVKQQDQNWLKDNIGAWIKSKSLEISMRKALTYMKTADMNVENMSSIAETVKNIIIAGTNVNLDFTEGSDFFNPESHKQKKLLRHSSGYDYIDICLKGGYWRGSLIVFLGMPKSGKSMWLCNLASKSVLAGNNTAYITLELQEELVTMRIGSNMLNVSLDEYENFAKDDELLTKKLNSLKTRHLGNLGQLHIKEFPSATASVNDIRNYLLKYEEIHGIKFKNVFIDYINIMKNWRNPNSENTYLKIKDLSQDLRAMGQENSWSVISVTQTNRTGWETSDLTLSSIAESAGLLHTVDVLFGIVVTQEMKAAGEYFLKNLANRVNGTENTRKRYIMNWKYARIEEDSSSPIEDMQSFIKETQTKYKSNFTSNPKPIIPPNKNNENSEIVNITGSHLFSIEEN